VVDISIRDYRQYFQPVLCYVEGTWMKEDYSPENPTYQGYDSFALSLSFVSEFNFRKNRASFASGRKAPQEDLAFLPRILHDVVYDENFTFQVCLSLVISSLILRCSAVRTCHAP
jgi:hypothetical protein